MQMNILIDALPNFVTIDGKDYKIDTDFRKSIQFEILIQESEKSSKDRVEKALNLFFDKNIPTNVEKAIEKILWFYSCGKLNQNATSNTENNSFHTRVYSFNHDSTAIYSAFWQQYKIDLTTAKLHWWQFKALFEGLSEDCLIVKIMQYRGMKITSDMPKSQQKRIRELKHIYALPVTQQEQSKIDEIDKILMGDGDLTGIL